MFGEYTFYRLCCDSACLVPLFAVRPTEWTVLPVKVCSPRRVASLCEASGHLGICLLAHGLAVPLLAYSLKEEPVPLTVSQIETLLQMMGQNVEKGNKQAKYLQLLRVVFPDLDEDSLNLIASAALQTKQTQKERSLQAVIDNPDLALSVEAMRNMQPEAAADFEDLAKAVDHHIFQKPPPDDDDDDIFGDSEGDADAAAPVIGDLESPVALGSTTPVAAPAAAAAGTPAPANSSSDDDSDSSDSSGGSDSEPAAAPAPAASAAAAPHARYANAHFKTPPCLRDFVSYETQGLWQDRRENRFKGQDKRTNETLVGELSSTLLSRSYGAARTHREALTLIIRWLWQRECTLSGHETPCPQLPAEGTESLELREVLTAEVASNYYGKAKVQAAG
jgi:hypothetical protein